MMRSMMKGKISKKDEQLARALADYDNLRKRVEAEKANWQRFATVKVVSRLLPVLDMLENSQQYNNDEGIMLAIKEFKNAFLDLGAEEIEVSVGAEFNPLYEEAVETVEGGKTNTIAEIVQSGWRMKEGNLVIRPAKVKVYGEKTEKEREIEKELQRGEYA
jgi:molecular chaperone GrpE